ncbi:MAG: DUF3179 domain-containing protein [Gemmataceae bacterium]|nr:DUF3179 domain-containing protein [Gemmataceae bacterium]
MQYPEIKNDPNLMLKMGATPMMLPGIKSPVAVSADEAGLADDAEVAGVRLHGKARAYLIVELSKMDAHVVNDQLGGNPVSVTFCDKNDCLRGFTSEKTTGPLQLGMGGWHGQGLILTYAGTMYAQENGRKISAPEQVLLPLLEFPVERTTWKAWRAKHPATEVVLRLEGALKRTTGAP